MRAKVSVTSSSIDSSEEPVWSKEKARQLKGALVIVGITHVDGEDNAISQYQVHGVIVETHPTKGVAVECHGEIWKGEKAWFPPDTRAWISVPPGEYRFRSTGEVIIDPQYTSSWTRQGPEQRN